jgi:hypothetical protein
VQKVISLKRGPEGPGRNCEALPALSTEFYFVGVVVWPVLVVEVAGVLVVPGVNT